MVTGGAGNDRFVFSPGGGNDTITDFGNGTDLIDLSPYRLPAADALTRTVSGNDLLLSVGTDTIRLASFLAGHAESDLVAVSTGSGSIAGLRLAAAATMLASTAASLTTAGSAGFSTTTTFRSELMLFAHHMK